MRYVVVVLIVATLALLAALVLTDNPTEHSRTDGSKSGAGSSDAAVGEPMGELQIIDEKVGDGQEAKTGDRVEVDYTGTLKNGTQFDSSVGRAPFAFRLGSGGVIKGWDVGVVGMKVGGRRKLIIPPHLGYGQHGSPPVIPPNSELTFVIDLLKIK